jgi:hypothetical protein
VADLSVGHTVFPRFELRPTYGTVGAVLLCRVSWEGGWKMATNNTMNNIGRYGLPAEPEREFVESAIAKLLEIAECQGITPADLIQMLDSGMRISDLLNALDMLAVDTTVN